MQAQLDINYKTLLNTDRNATIDYELIQHMGGAGGLKALEDAFTSQCGPLENNMRTLDEAATASKKLVSGDLFHMVSEAAQLQVQKMADVVQNLAKNKTPTCVSSPSTWQATLWTSLPNYFVHGGTSDKSATALYGVPALEKAISDLQTSSSKDAKQIERLEVWLPFMSAQSEKDLDSLRKDTARGKKRQPKAHAVDAKGTESKDKGAGQSEAEQAVLAMLKRRRSS
eukprot:5728698-Amphidinium_carterae.1